MELANVLPQITTVFALAGAYFGFGYLVIKGHSKIPEALKPDLENPQQIKTYLSAAANHRQLIYRWFIAGFAAVTIVVALLVFQSWANAKLQLLNEQKIHLEANIKDLEVDISKLELDMNELDQKLDIKTHEWYICQASNPEILRNTLLNG